MKNSRVQYGHKGFERILDRDDGRADHERLTRAVFDSQSARTVGKAKEDFGTAGILGTLSESGLTYVKEVLVSQILAEITPLSLPDIKAHVNSPIGHVDTQITKIELSGANVSYSDVELGKKGITMYAANIRAHLRLHWFYEYSSDYVPFPINDGGWADVEVSASPFLSVDAINRIFLCKLHVC